MEKQHAQNFPCNGIDEQVFFNQAIQWIRKRLLQKAILIRGPITTTWNSSKVRFRKTTISRITCYRANVKIINIMSISATQTSGANECKQFQLNLMYSAFISLNLNACALSSNSGGKWGLFHCQALCVNPFVVSSLIKCRCPDYPAVR